MPHDGDTFRTTLRAIFPKKMNHAYEDFEQNGGAKLLEGQLLLLQ